jgi:predicted amidophosphoribosyltransferase
MRAALATIEAPPGPIVVIGVPGSNEAQLADGQPVARLARAVAKQWRGTLDLTMVQKNPHSPIHGKRVVDERRAILDAANYRTTHNNEHAKTFVLVDDFLTRGDTMQRIITAIARGAPDAIFWALAIAKTENLDYWRGRGRELTNNEATEYEEAWTAVYMN